nr:multiple rna-binding domain-containing protein 1 [Quercus suber]
MADENPEPASSRVFVKGLPPTFSEADFKKHFSQKSEVTDVKIFQNRRIGFIGYRTPEDAQRAVKYFNKSFIRMSRIGVELAAPIAARVAPTKSTVAMPVEDSKKKRKRPGQADENNGEEDPKLKEFLEVMRPKNKSAWNKEAINPDVEAEESIPIEEAASDGEYEAVPKRPKRSRREPSEDHGVAQEEDMVEEGPLAANEPGETTNDPPGPISDADWRLKQTSRLLGLLDDDEEEEMQNQKHHASESEEELSHTRPSNKPTEDGALIQGSIPTPPSEDLDKDAEEEKVTPDDTTMRLFVRNLPYNVKTEDLESAFTTFGAVEEVHVSQDKKTGLGKGFAFVQFSSANSAEEALKQMDGQPFQGRLLHVIPATAKREKLDDFELSKLPLKKQQQIKRRKDAAVNKFNWNALYMNVDAVVSSVAERLGIPKSEVLDPTSSDAAVKQAHAETHIIQETKAYFKSQGVDLDAFKRSQRGDTAILVKNIPSNCSRDELQRLFAEHGDIKRLLVPSSGVIAIVEYANAAQCKAAYGSLAYTRLKSSMLFLEKAPRDLFSGKVSTTAEPVNEGISKTSATELKDGDRIVQDTAGTATLFVRNLNFSTTTAELGETFKPVDGFMSARVKTKTDPKKPDVVLSMGFGFLEFRSSAQAQAALLAMDGYMLAGHKLQIRASHQGTDKAEERRKADAAKRAAGKNTKIIIKNLPFETTKKDVRALFSAYGQLRSVRVPKKMDRGARGFAFADFITPKEAESAMDALRDTHLLGRRLVLDFAAGDAEDAEAEIEKMQHKVGSQVNKVALQKLTSGGRKKFTTANDDDMLE